MIISNKQLEAIEKAFVEAVNEMDRYAEMKDEQRAGGYAAEACAIARVIGIMRNTNEDEAHAYLYNKYNLHKTEETTAQYPELTDLEKKTIKQALSYGFAYDHDTNEKGMFVCWGVDGKQERGALVSLHKKGVLNIYREDGDTYVNCGAEYCVKDLEKMAGIIR